MRSYVCVSVFMMLLAACGGSDKGASQVSSSAGADEGCGGDEGESSGCGGEYSAATATAGIKGVVKWEGKAPLRRMIDMGSEKFCVQTHAGDEMRSETTIVGPGGELKNVFVHITKGLGNWKFPVPSETKELDQQGCAYVPHVIGMQVGQSLKVLNGDPILHNVHGVNMRTRKDEFNKGQPNKGAHFSRTFRRPSMISVKCDVHGWMQSYIHVVKDPFYAVTGDAGAFALDKLPAGTYTVVAWHEKWGTQTQTVTVKDGETAEISFTFSKKRS